MKLIVLGSGSQGNGYLFLPENGTPGLLIEAGIPMKAMLKAVHGDISKVGALFVTHEHSDHARRVQEYMERGIPTYMTQGTWESLSGKVKSSYAGHSLKVLATVPNVGDGKSTYPITTLPGWEILPFRTVHDAKEPIGLLMWHEEMGTTLFVTDSQHIPFIFEDLNNVMIESNYTEDLLQERDLPEGMKDRIRASHMSIDTCVNALLANDLTKVNKIILLHLSAVDGDPEGFAEMVRDVTGKDVAVAQAGMSMTLNKTPF